MKKYHSQGGFTLTEMSIVIIIVAFIVGAFTYGKSYMNKSRLLSVIRDINNYKTAIEAFKFKYSEIPGDFSVATSYWSGCSNNGTNTCNGNGNGIITTDGNENGRAWQHLSLSKLIDETYPGSVNDATALAGTDYPRSAIKSGGYGILTRSNDNETFNIAITLDNVVGVTVDDGVVTATDAWFIDHKIDDSTARSGHVFSEGDCLDTATPKQYDLDDTSSTCTLHFAIKL